MRIFIDYIHRNFMQRFNYFSLFVQNFTFSAQIMSEGKSGRSWVKMASNTSKWPVIRQNGRCRVKMSGFSRTVWCEPIFSSFGERSISFFQQFFFSRFKPSFFSRLRPSIFNRFRQLIWGRFRPSTSGRSDTPFSDRIQYTVFLKLIPFDFLKSF